MTEVYSKALRKHIQIDRVIAHLKGPKSGPTLVFIAGIHGNEPSGVFALNEVMSNLKQHQKLLHGSIYALGGNLWALKRGVRFHKEDLNRIWTEKHLQAVDEEELEISNDKKEQRALFEQLKTIIKQESGPFYFFDLHTTSSETTPFLTVNDSMLNRKFTTQYPLPIILGIEEYIEGPVLSYINEKGYVSFGFEAGQHDDLSSIENHIAFTYLSLFFTKVVKEDLIDFHRYYDRLAKTTGDIRKIYEIYYRYRIRPNEIFRMKPGFFNFQLIRKGEILAESNGKPIRTSHRGRIFMPLYQNQGEEGFFAIREIQSIFLVLSSFFRKVRLERILVLLPGVKWFSKEKSKLLVNRNIAFLFAKQLFHLLGYRSSEMSRQYLILKNREHNARTKEYESEPWMAT